MSVNTGIARIPAFSGAEGPGATATGGRGGDVYHVTNLEFDKDGVIPGSLNTVNITIQYSIFSEALNTYHHAFGSTIGGYNSTFHHNLWASNTGRNPSVGMIYDFTFAYNVVFNWRHRTTDGGDHRSFYNIINNYFKPGPVTPRDRRIGYRFLKPESRRAKPAVDDYGRANDGMPDEWETRHGLDPKDASDASADLNGDGYTNIEDFINGLDPSAPKREWPTPRTYQDRWNSDPDLKARLERR